MAITLSPEGERQSKQKLWPLLFIMNLLWGVPILTPDEIEAMSLLEMLKYISETWQAHTSA